MKPALSFLIDSDDKRVAKKLEQNIRILCWVMTSPKNHQSHAIHILKTWGKRCTKLLFVSEGTDSSLPIINVKVDHGREHLTAKTMGAFDHIYEHHIVSVIISILPTFGRIYKIFSHLLVAINLNICFACLQAMLYIMGYVSDRHSNLTAVINYAT